MSTETSTTTTTPTASFPYFLSDIDYWVVRRKDGTVAKFSLGNTGEVKGGQARTVPTSATQQFPLHSSLSAYCRHEGKEPVFETDTFTMYIADSPGVKKEKHNFDIIIDCGDVFFPSEFKVKPLLEGEEGLVRALSKHQLIGGYGPTAKLLQIDWLDRQAPKLSPAFWPDLAKRLKGDVVINCQGGHGRSGTGLVCLLMATHPAYSPLDGIIQLRALHCPRAIESVVQHEYLNEVAAYLKRPQNALHDAEIKNYREEFTHLKVKGVGVYQEWLKQREEKERKG